MPAHDVALRQGFALTRAQARDCGLAERDVRRFVRRRAWTVARYGVVSPLPAAATGPSGAGPEVAATGAALVWTDTAISHASAAAVQSLPILRAPGPPTLTADHPHRACSRADVRLHIAGLPDVDRTTWFGSPVTTPARTVVDLARSRGVASGLVAADAVLREGLASYEELCDVVDRQSGWPGVRAARRAVRLADDRAESPLESLARLLLFSAGLPIPELQPRVETAGGRYRVDMLYPRERVVIELDGLLKYRVDPHALVEEKLRQEALERAGYRVIRLLWDDVVRHPARTLARVRAALAT